MNEYLNKLLFEISLEESNDDLGIDRELLKNVTLTPSLILTVQGVRRSGKSIFIKQIMQHFKIEQESFYINFEDPRLSDLLDYKLLDAIITYHEKDKHKKYYYFFDEIQNVVGWEKWLHIQVAKKKRCFVITGSNSQLLSGKLGAALTGRHLTIEVFPFSFYEFKKFTGESFESYLSKGGFPLALSVDFSKELLKNYFSDIIERDVKRVVAARSSRMLLQVAKAIFESSGSELSFRNLAKTFETTADTIKTYVDAFEACYLIFSCPYFTYSERKSLVRAKKYYPIDNGLREAIVTKSGLDKGKSFEIFIFLSLRRKYKEIYYWKGTREIDFVIETEDGIRPIQVTINEIKDRHKEAALEFKKEYPKALPCFYVTMENLLEFETNFL
ncbi:MAG: ATP-binding protein [Bacteriovoracaceae bacterium]